MVGPKDIYSKYAHKAWTSAPSSYHHELYQLACFTPLHIGCLVFVHSQRYPALLMMASFTPQHIGCLMMQPHTSTHWMSGFCSFPERYPALMMMAASHLYTLDVWFLFTPRGIQPSLLMMASLTPHHIGCLVFLTPRGIQPSLLMMMARRMSQPTTNEKYDSPPL
jgi:hypothetical protein